MYPTSRALYGMYSSRVLKSVSSCRLLECWTPAAQLLATTIALMVNCHHLAENPSSDFTLSRGAFLIDLASLTALFQGLLHLVQRCVVDIFIDDVCNELASFRISHRPTDN